MLAACGGGDGGPGTAAEAPNPSGAPSGGTVANATPKISGTPQAAAVADTAYAFKPTATDADGDILTFSVANSPPWAAFDPRTGELSGTPTSGDIGTYEGIQIKVTDGAADAQLAPFTIAVNATAGGAVQLSWAAPTQNEDGSPLTDLAGYKIYWGTTSGDYPNSVTIDSPGIVTYMLENLVPATYYFIATAINTEGAESAPSEEAVGTVS